MLTAAWGGLPCESPVPDGWTDMRTVAAGLRTDIRYHTPANFTGGPLQGYGVPGAWLRAAPAAALGRVHEALEAEGFGLLIYDAYRPLRGTLSMVAWAKRTGNVALLDQGYIARRSNHNRGNTVDLTLFDLATGEPLDMGTAWDTLTPASHTANATGRAARHRQLLVKAMRAQGWVNYSKEWWHFTWHPDQKPRARDIPYGVFEAAEGAWVPPVGWEDEGWVAPSWPVQPCGGAVSPSRSGGAPTAPSTDPGPPPR